MKSRIGRFLGIVQDVRTLRINRAYTESSVDDKCYYNHYNRFTAECSCGKQYNICDNEGAISRAVIISAVFSPFVYFTLSGIAILIPPKVLKSDFQVLCKEVNGHLYPLSAIVQIESLIPACYLIAG